MSRELMEERLSDVERVWLFLDYDGTLTDFAPTPQDVKPNPKVVSLLKQLAGHPRIRVAVISGRPLSDVERLVPVPGIMLTGTYGLELRMLGGELINRVKYDVIRPPLDVLKPRWQRLIAGREGFYLEDKGWALAIHTRFADEGEAERVLSAAQHDGREELESSGEFRLLGGDRFFEVAPRLADKGKAVEYILSHCHWPGALPIYVGDDDKDEAAFRVIRTRGGIAILVGRWAQDTAADHCLESPRLVRRWLWMLPAVLEG